MFAVSNKITTLPGYLVYFNFKATEDCAADPAVFLVFCVSKTQPSFLYVSFTSHASTPHTTLHSDKFGHQTRGGLPHPAIPPGQWVPYSLTQFWHYLPGDPKVKGSVLGDCSHPFHRSLRSSGSPEYPQSLSHSATNQRFLWSPPSVDLINLLEQATEGKEHFTYEWDLLKVTMQQMNNQMRHRCGRVPHAGTFVPVELGCDTPQVRACAPRPGSVLSSYRGNVMEALSHRHDGSLTSCSALFLLKRLGWGWKCHLSNGDLVFPVTSPHQRAISKPTQGYTRVSGALCQSQRSNKMLLLLLSPRRLPMF